MTDLVIHYGYLAVFLLMLGESAALPIPSEIVMPFAGAFCDPSLVQKLSAGATPLNLPLVIAAGAAGNLAGSLIAYGAGRLGGPPLLRRMRDNRYLGHGKLERAETWFNDHGNITVFTSRLLPVVRTFISLPAGAAEMPIVSFSFYTIVGSAIWSAMLAIIGYLLGSQWELLDHIIAPIGYALAAALVVAAAWWILRVKRRA
jgi:membrane protein DedA with SNARE-associated domain